MMRWPKLAASHFVRTSLKQEASGNISENRPVNRNWYLFVLLLCLVLMWEVSVDLSSCITSGTQMLRGVCFYPQCLMGSFLFLVLTVVFLCVYSAVWWLMLCRETPFHQRWTMRPDKESTQSVFSWPGTKRLSQTHRGGYSEPHTMPN